jgi:hypothetical protein
LRTEDSIAQFKKALCERFNRDLVEELPVKRLREDSFVLCAIVGALQPNPLSRPSSKDLLKVIMKGFGVNNKEDLFNALADDSEDISEKVPGQWWRVPPTEFPCLPEGKRRISDVIVQYVNDELGYGVFANEPIPCGTNIAVYSGEVSIRESSLRSSSPSLSSVSLTEHRRQRFWL